MSCLQNAVRNLVAVQTLAGLVNQHDAVDDEQRARRFTLRFLQHEAGDFRLSASGRRHQHLLAMTGADSFAHGFHR
jgi:hypothetical protein